MVTLLWCGPVGLLWPAYFRASRWVWAVRRPAS
jgi:hypothetical protein